MGARARLESGAHRLSDILKAQMEDHRADVVLQSRCANRLGFATLIKSLPGCVKHVIAWHAATFRAMYRLPHYDLVVCNFLRLLRQSNEQGCRTGTLLSSVRSAIWRPLPVRGRIGPSMWCSSGVIRAITSDERKYWKPWRNSLVNIISLITSIGHGCAGWRTSAARRVCCHWQAIVGRRRSGPISEVPKIRTRLL